MDSLSLYTAVYVIFVLAVIALLVLLFLVLLAALKALKTYVRVQELKVDLLLADDPD
ncbi:MAG: hypothetical protein ABWY68_12325 [Cryobacterium sp.]